MFPYDHGVIQYMHKRVRTSYRIDSKGFPISGIIFYFYLNKRVCIHMTPLL